MARTRRNRSRSRRNKNFIKRTFKTGMNAATTTSRRYMPKVKSGLESVGSKVTKTATKTIPVLQKTTRNIFSMLGIKKKGRK